MSHYRRVGARLLAPTLLLLIILLAACGGSSTPQAQTKPIPTPTPSPSPTPGPGQLLLNTVGQKLSTAKTLHGVFNLTITGESFSGMVNTEIWNVAPDKNRTVVLQSSISQIHTGSVTVTDGKTIWQYDPVENVVYTGPVSATPGAGTATPTSGFVGAGNSQSLLNLVQSVFTSSNATLASSSARVNGHDAYDVHVVPQGVSGFNYTGEIYIDKTTELPLHVDLVVSGLGHIVLDIPTLALNQPIADSTFTFVTPPGATVKPLQQATPSSGTLTLAQAQQQAGYHLLSIPASQTDYELEGVTALGSPGSQIYTLNYIKGNISFTIVEGKPLANLPHSSGEQISIRGTTGTLSTSNGSTLLAWTENGVGIQIQGNLSKDQVVAIANLLS